MTESNLLYGAHYFNSDNPHIFTSGHEHLYYFETYIGKHLINVEQGDCIFFIDENLKNVHVKKGTCQINSKHCATVIRGYMHPDACMSLEGVTLLPYVNGCSTKQLFPPLRLGDPTLQYLKIPPYSKEQKHHIHSTVRVVYVLSGKGKSIVGLENNYSEYELAPGTVCILEPMSPHHFETPQGEPLVVIPLHIFSSISNMEQNHPMFNGTIPV